MESDADYTQTHAGDCGPGVHRAGQKGRHGRSGAREIFGQIMEPLAAPGQTKPAPGLGFGNVDDAKDT
jgi:hypothetical protein